MTHDSTEACTHRMRTYKSVKIGDHRKRYRKCVYCDYHDTLPVPMEFSYLKFDPVTKVGNDSVEQSSQAPTLE